MEATKENRTAIMAAMTEKFKEKVQHGSSVFALVVIYSADVCFFLSMFQDKKLEEVRKNKNKEAEI